MHRFTALALGAFAAVAGILTVAGAASAGSFLSNRESRSCEDPHILAKIVDRFHHQTRNVPHLPDVDITDFRKIHEHRYLPYRDNWPIARRYCGATAELSDGRARTIWYLIEDGMGLAGMGDNVEFCVSGFDRWMVYNGRCRILR
jgi:hypothetical protein